MYNNYSIIATLCWLMLFSSIHVVNSTPTITSIIYGSYTAEFSGTNLQQYQSVSIWSGEVEEQPYYVTVEYISETTMGIYFGHDVPLGGRIVFDMGLPTESVSVYWNPICVTTVIPVPSQGGIVTVQGAMLKYGNGNKLNISTADQGNKIYSALPSSTDTDNYFQLSDLQPIGQGYQSVFSMVPTNPSGTKQYPFTYRVSTPYVDNVIISSQPWIQINGGSFGMSAPMIIVSLDGLKLEVQQLINHYNITLKYSNNNTYPFIGDHTYFNIPGYKGFSISVNGADMPEPYIVTVKPVVTGVNSVPYEGGQVTVSGIKLASNLWSGAYAQTSVLIGGVECVYEQAIHPSTELVCDMPKATGQSSNLPVVVAINGVSSTDSVSFTYGPMVSDAFQFGNSIIVQGQRLGNQALLNRTSLLLSDDSQRVLTPYALQPGADQSSDQVIFVTIPKSAQLGQLINVSVLNLDFLGMWANTSTAFTLINPMTLTLVSDVPPVSGGNVTFQINSPVALFPDHVSEADLYIPQCVKIATVPHSSNITCTLQAGSGKDLSLTVSLMNVSSAAITGTYKYLPPTVTSAGSVGVNGGRIIIKGDNFANSTDLSVKIANTVTCHNVLVLDPQTIQCDLLKDEIPTPLPTGFQPLEVKVSDQYATGLIFKYTPTPPPVTSTSTTSTSTTSPSSTTTDSPTSTTTTTSATTSGTPSDSTTTTTSTTTSHPSGASKLLSGMPITILVLVLSFIIFI
ncbi:hypothetical protein SAMD00019534_018210 [Acytostelium subglobosum LB1]|uniref:hypothetical protein n=1 Tax=Acytostelium subglobosum LB1 TaxID=1410327 RepID=UPI000644F7AB|nr:hypothetical protein SAMD00019534_018210 [Acytostelium subglobosum LB1]GAM18646.1 hypothetical protein SAMD00019534_018210 [Acytostelium subglobosum LB1]|eukprot:XP_012757866.1 hypothetical protein SAMD00019534_018210 [Acytostelium subglobosum LB1]